jgi:glutathione peroxidase
MGAAGQPRQTWRTGLVLLVGLCLLVVLVRLGGGALAGADAQPQPQSQLPALEKAAQRQRLLDHEVRRLNSDETVHLLQHVGAAPLLIVNTASRCGFTGQFASLEAVHQRYRDAGLRVLGFSSNDFRQELTDEAAVAGVCFINFGVTFDMFASVPVRGAGAHPVFLELARQSEQPAWNFHKYLVDASGRVVAAFPSRVSPEDPVVLSAIEALL